MPQQKPGCLGTEQSSDSGIGHSPTRTGYVCRLPVSGTLRTKMIQVLFDMMGDWLANNRGWVWLRLTSHEYSRQLVRSLESTVTMRLATCNAMTSYFNKMI